MTQLLKHHTILYIEDEPEIQQSITTLLQSYFKEVFVASDGEEGLAAFHTHRPDALLFDINLPKMTGLELTREIRKSHPDIPAVLLTAYTDEEKILAAIDLNIKKYLVKPVKNRDFKDALHKISQHLLKASEFTLKLGEKTLWHALEKALYNENEEVPLSNHEKSLMHLLAEHHKVCVSHEDIMAIVWEDEFEKEITFDSVKNLVKNLRKKLPKGAIESIYGRGYMLH